MTYVTMFKKQVARNFQSSSAVWKNAPTSAGSALAKCKNMINLLSAYRPTGSVETELETLSALSEDDNNTTNAGNYGDFVIVFTRETTADVPGKLVAKLDNCTSANIDNKIKSFFTLMLNNQTGYTNYVATCVNVVIH